MAKRLMVSTGIQFDSINKLKKEAQSILDSVSKQISFKITNVDISDLDKTIDKINKKIGSLNKGKIDIDGLSSAKSLEELAKTLREVQGMSKYKVELMSDGQVKVITNVNNELKETVRTMKSLTTGNTNISISGNVDKNKKDIYNEIVKLQKTEYDLKTKLLTADGEYAKVLQEQLANVQKIKEASVNNVNKSKLADETLYNNLLKERSTLESKLSREQAKVDTAKFNKINQDLLKQNDYLDKTIAKLKIYQQSVNNKGGGKPTEQADLSGAISSQISKLQELKRQNELLGTAEKNRINSTVSDMRVQTNELVKYESSFSNLFKRMGMYAFGGSLIYSGIAEVKKGINDIITLDSAMRDLSRVAKATQEQLDNFTSVANNMAKEVGASTEAIIKATEYYSKLGYAIDEASQRASNATIFSNVSDMGIDDASKALISIQKGFGLDTIEDMVHIMDSLNEVGNNFSSSTEDIAEGLKRSSSALREGNNSLEESIGLFVSANSAIQDAEVTGTALRTISLRLKGMETDLGDSVEPVSKLRNEMLKMTDSVGKAVDIMESDGVTFRSTYDIVNDLSGVWNNLTDSQRSWLSAQIAGQRQANVFSSLLFNMTDGVNAYETALDSAGSAQLEQSKYMDSIEGKMNQFSETLKSIWVDGINSDTIKGIVDFGTTALEIFGKMSNTFGILPTTIGVATTALVLFNKEMYIGMTKNIPIVGGLSLKLDNMAKSTQMSVGRVISSAFNKFADSMTTAGAKATVLTAKNTTLAISFKAVEVASALANAAMTMGLSLAITAVIGGITKLIDKLIVTKEEMREMNEESTRFVTESGEAISKAQELLNKKTALEDQIKNTSDVSKRTELETQLLDIEKQLASVLPESATGFNEQGEAISANNGLIEEQIRLKKEQMEIESLGFLENNRKLASELSGLDAKKKKYEDMKLAMIKGEKYREDYSYTDPYGQEIKGSTSQKVTQEDLDKLNQEIQDVTLKASQAQVHIKWLLTNGYSLNEITSMGFDASAVENYIKSVNKATDAIETNTQAKRENSNANGEVGGISIEEATKSYGEAVSKVKELDEMLQKINETQALTPDIVANLAKNYSDIGANITSVAGVQEYLNNKINEQVAIQQEAYQIMVGDDTNYYNERIKNSSEAQAVFDNFAKQFTDVNGANYDVDLDNFSTLNEAKNESINQLSEPLGQFIANLVGGNAEGYAKDIRNTKSWAEAKALIISKLDDQITKIENRLNSFASNISQSATSLDALAQEKFAIRASNQLRTLQAERAKIETAFNDFYAGFDTTAPVFGRGSSGIGGSGGSKAGSGSKSATEKEIADLENLTDRYYQVNNALDQVNNQLKTNKTLMENSSDSDRLKYLDKEIQLLQKQKTALQNVRKERQEELSELKRSLSSKGFSFRSDGTIGNYESRLNQLTNYANSLSGDNKENAIANVKNIAEQLQKYTQLLIKDIPQVTNEIDELKNTTIDTQKEIAEILEKQKDTYIDNIRKETDALKKEINRRKELLNSQWEEEDYNDELKKRQTALLDLEAQLQDAMRMADNELIASIRKEIQSAQSEIDNFIRDNERDKANDRFDTELNKLDEQTQAKIDEINNQLSEEQILALVQNGVRDLNNVLNDIGNANAGVVSSFASVGAIIQDDWLGNLDKFINELRSIPVLDMSLNANVKNASNQAKGNITISMPITIEGDVNEDTLEDLEVFVDNKINYAINKVKSELYGR